MNLAILSETAFAIIYVLFATDFRGGNMISKLQTDTSL